MFAVRIVLLLAAVVTASSAYAGAPKSDGKNDFIKGKFNGITFAVPKASGLKAVKDDEEGIHFKGEIRVSGTYVYGFESDYVSDSGAPREPDLYFLPDEASRALLPYWYERGPVLGFHFSNPEAFERAAIDAAAAAKVKARRVRSITGKLTIWVDQYVATGECDGPVYTAHFLRVDRAPDVVARNAFADPISCG